MNKSPILLLTLLLCLQVSARTVTLTPLSTTIAADERLMAAIAIDTLFANPYDPDCVRVDALISRPDDGIDAVPCFWYEPVTMTKSGNAATAVRDSGAGLFQLRYLPRIAGLYSIRVRVIANGDTATSVPVEFTATGVVDRPVYVLAPNSEMSTNRGVPIGHNLCWNDGSLVTFYTTDLEVLKKNRCTWTRYWLTDFAQQALEWSAGHWSNRYRGLGYYSQESAALLDSVLALADESGIGVQLVLQHHGQFSTTDNAEWNAIDSVNNPGNPYNRANGGPITLPAQFFTDVTAKAQTKKLYRYYVARYSAYASLFAWELFNEVDLTDGDKKAVVSWHAEMASYLRSLDYARHIVTTSSTDNAWLALLDTVRGIDLLQFHAYARSVDAVVASRGAALNATLDHPVWCGEYGTDGLDYAAHPDTAGLHIRHTLLKSLFNGFPSFPWYWEYLLDDRRGGEFKTVAAFLDNAAWFGTNDTAAVPRIAGFPVGDTVFAVPGIGWDSSKTKTFVMQSDGSFPGIENLSSYLQGSWGIGFKSADATFTVDFDTAGTAFIDVVLVSAAGIKQVKISVDGVDVGAHYFDNPGLWGVPVSAGTHVVKFRSTGEDWIVVSRYGFSGVAVPAVSVQCRVTTNGRDAAFRFRDERTGEWGAGDSLSGGLLYLPDGASVNQLQCFVPMNDTLVAVGGAVAVSPDGSFLIPPFRGELLAVGTTTPSGVRSPIVASMSGLRIRIVSNNLSVVSRVPVSVALLSLDGRTVAKETNFALAHELHIPTKGCYLAVVKNAVGVVVKKVVSE